VNDPQRRIERKGPAHGPSACFCGPKGPARRSCPRAGTCIKSRIFVLIFAILYPFIKRLIVGAATNRRSDSFHRGSLLIENARGSFFN
jgi:hypothetical protein